MTRSRTKLSTCPDALPSHLGAEQSSLGPHEFSSIPFPVKTLKLLLHDVQSGGESATITAQGGSYDEIDSDDGVSRN
jgi:hypothetical protein